MDSRVHLEALDARAAWPPLLRPGVLAGHQEYDTVERRLLRECQLAQLGVATTSTSTLLHRLLNWGDALRQWRPDTHPLLRVCEELPFPVAASALHDRGEPTTDVSKDLIGMVPPEWRPDSWPAGIVAASDDGAELTKSEAEAALVRYLGTRLVASWVAYQGEGVRSVLASLVSSYVLAVQALEANGRGAITFGRMTSAIRAADWLQLHLLDRQAWATWCAQWERCADATPLHRLVATAHQQLDALPWRPAALTSRSEAARIV